MRAALHVIVGTCQLSPFRLSVALNFGTTSQQSAVVNRGAILAIILISYLMIVLDISIVITGLLLLGARAGDILGRRRMFIAGLVIFTVASMAIGLAMSPAWLLIARAVQGLGAAILAPRSAWCSAAFSPTGGPGVWGSLSIYLLVLRCCLARIAISPKQSDTPGSLM
jgi:MFS family permease